jgi:hypothetical protein
MIVLRITAVMMVVGSLFILGVGNVYAQEETPTPSLTPNPGTPTPACPAGTADPAYEIDLNWSLWCGHCITPVVQSTSIFGDIGLPTYIFDEPTLTPTVFVTPTVTSTLPIGYFAYPMEPDSQYWEAPDSDWNSNINGFYVTVPQGYEVKGLYLAVTETQGTTGTLKRMESTGGMTGYSSMFNNTSDTFYGGTSVCYGSGCTNLGMTALSTSGFKLGVCNTSGGCKLFAGWVHYGQPNVKTGNIRAWYPHVILYGRPYFPTPLPTATQVINHDCADWEYSGGILDIDETPVLGWDGIVVTEGDCVTVIPGIDWDLSAVDKIIGIDWNLTIPEIKLCPNWVTIPELSILGFELPLELFALPIVGALLKWILSL